MKKILHWIQDWELRLVIYCHSKPELQGALAKMGKCFEMANQHEKKNFLTTFWPCLSSFRITLSLSTNITISFIFEMLSGLVFSYN